ncbi:MAG: hypothetical protein JNK58_03345 [Phycisphaerae bacterium]|nr:hypothetical protein [Phycisphaerae bacterium]
MGVLAATPARGAEPPPLPSAADCISTFNTIQSWVRDWTVSHEAQPIDPPGTTGACVTLRLGGRVLGRGTSFADDRVAAWRAAREAFVQAVESLPVEEDALRARRIEEMTPRVTLDIQFSGRLTPLLIEDESAMAHLIAPGVEGLAARIGARIEGVFPGAMLSTGTTAVDGLRVAMSRLNLPPRPLPELKRSTDLVVYRFSVRHLAQPREQAAPEFLFRGGRVISSSEVTGSRLREAAAAISAHLVSHAWPGVEPCGMTGDYRPLIDRYEPMIAEPLEQAACAFALARYATTPGIAERDASRARRFAAEILDRLTAIAPDEKDPADDPIASGMWLAAHDALRESGVPDTAPSEFKERVLATLLRTVTMRDGSFEWTADAPIAGRGVLALALASVARHDDSKRALAVATVRSLYRDTEAARLVSEMPWLGWAELALTERNDELPSAVALIEMRRAATNFQLKEEDLDANEADLLGGTVFTRSRAPLPTWNSLRPAAFFATMLGDPRMTPAAEVLPELSRLRASLRFLLQLMIDDPVLHMYRDRERSIGGVRPAVWEQSAALEPAAMALLTLSEALRAMDARSPRGAPPAGSP